MRLILLGAPGSGKGAQAQKLCEKFGIPHISTGDIFREEIGKKTDLGNEVSGYVSSGRLVPDQLVVRTVVSRLEKPDCLAGFLLDGFPRTAEQAEELESYLSKKGLHINRVVFLDVPSDVLVQRVAGRRHCEKCAKVYNIATQPPQAEGVCDACGGKLILRVDDDAATVRRRLSVYEDLTAPLVAFYKARGALASIGAVQDMDSVSRQVLSVLENSNGNS